MARQSRTQTTIRAGGRQDSAVQPAQVAERGYNPSVYYHNIRADRSIGASEHRMSKALSGLEQPLTSLMVKKEREDNKVAQAKAAADYAQNPVPLPEAIARDAEAREKNGEAYADAQLGLAVSSMAARRSTEIEKEISANPLWTPEQIDEYYQQQMKNDLSPLADHPEIQGAYADNMLSMREKHIARRSQQKQQEEFEIRDRDYMMGLDGALRDGAEAGYTPNQTLELLRAHQENYVTAGGSPADAAAMSVDALIAYAEESGDPDILDILTQSVPSMEDPDVMVPGPGHSKKHARTIAQARQRIESKVKREQLEAEKEAVDSFKNEFYGNLRDGDVAGALNMLDDGVESGVISEGEAYNYERQIANTQASNLKQYANEQNWAAGYYDQIPAKDRQPMMDQWANEKLQEADKSGDESQQVAAYESVVRKMGESGIWYSPFKRMLSSMDYSDPKRFALQIAQLNSIQALAPEMYGRLPEEVQMSHHRVNNLKRDGYPQDYIMSSLMELQTEEGRQAVKDAKSGLKPTTAADAERLEQSTVEHFGGYEDITNKGIVRDHILKSARTYLAMHPGSTEDEAVEYATQRAGSLYTIVEFEDGSERAIYTGSVKKDSRFPAVMQNGVDAVNTLMQQTFPERKHGKYYLQADPRDPTSGDFVIVDEQGQMMALPDAEGNLQYRAFTKEDLDANYEAKRNEEIKAQHRQVTGNVTGPDDYMPPYED